MAVGDRVVCGDGSTWNDQVTISVYEPFKDPAGNFHLDHFGAAQVSRVGGVKGGSTGTIAGPSVRVHRTQLVGESNVPHMAGVDVIHLFPVTFDHYQRTAYVPAHHMRVVGGQAR